MWPPYYGRYGEFYSFYYGDVRLYSLPSAWKPSEDKMGMTITSGSVSLMKDDKNLIGISIGGGAPLCPCLYIVQVFDNTPASSDGTLQCGDELVGVNGQSVKGKTKVEVAKMIQAAKEEVIVNYNKLHADPVQGKSLDIIMKKVKHRLVENMSTSTADALGLSRAILSKDLLVVKLKELQATEQMYKGLVDHTKRMLKAYFDLLQTYKNFGDIFAAIGVREPQPRASEAFSKFGCYHRELEKEGIKMIKTLKPIIADMGTYLNKAIPDTKLTISKYADVKFEYLSYCLKVKEMDDEEVGFSSMQEPLYRVETGNYEYRLILRCRQDARARFAQLRSDVMVKLELLDSKHIQDLGNQLQKFLTGQSAFHNETHELLKEHSSLFPVEVDLSQNAFQYKSTMPIYQDQNDEFDGIDEISMEATEALDVGRNRLIKIEKGDQSETLKLLPDLDDCKAVNPLDMESITESTSLLAELGLDNIMPLTLHPTSSAIMQPDMEFSEFMSNVGDIKKSDSMTNLLSGFD